jgi:hypothetical protein
MVAATALELNTRYSGRYSTKARYSAQGTARRKFTVLWPSDRTETTHARFEFEQQPPDSRHAE